MTCNKTLSSFPNTRQRPRKPTQKSDTNSFNKPIPTGISQSFDTSGGNEPLEANEGEYTLNNNMIVKAYNQNRTYLTLRNGHSKFSIRYGYEDHADLGTRGMLLRAGDSVDIESPQTVYVSHDAGETVDEVISIFTDYGEG